MSILYSISLFLSTDDGWLSVNTSSIIELHGRLWQFFIHAQWCRCSWDVILVAYSGNKTSCNWVPSPTGTQCGRRVQQMYATNRWIVVTAGGQCAWIHRRLHRATTKKQAMYWVPGKVVSSIDTNNQNHDFIVKKSYAWAYCSQWQETGHCEAARAGVQKSSGSCYSVRPCQTNSGIRTQQIFWHDMSCLHTLSLASIGVASDDQHQATLSSGR